MKAQESDAMKRQERQSQLENIDTIRQQLDDKTNQAVRIYGSRASLAGAA